MAKTKHSKHSPSDEGVMVKGSFRIQITEDGEVVGDTGWVKNQVTRTGWQQFLAGNLMNAAGSTMRVGYVALGTGVVPDASTTSLPGEAGNATNRVAIGANTQVSTATNGASAVMSATFPSNAAFTQASTIQNIGLYSGSSGSGLFAGASYATQAVATNQAVNVTYTVGFN